MTLATSHAKAADLPIQAAGGIRIENIIQFLLWPAIALGSISFLEPSPTDLFLLPLMLVWFLGDFRFHRAHILPFALILTRFFAELFSLFPFLTDADAVSYVTYSGVVTVMCLFTALLLASNTSKRVEIFLKAYFWSCLIAAAFGIGSSIDLFGSAEKFAPGGRTLGTFKDPNVMGSYCILGALVALQAVLLNTTRHVVWMTAGFLAISLAILLTFSRGSVGALVLEILMLVGLSYFTASTPAQGRRVAVVFMGMAALLALALLVLLSNSDFREIFTQRSALIQDYDGGETGRFGNQARSIPLILDKLFTGLGPLQFRHIFDLEPHNSYISAFANAGIVGGFTLVAIVLTTGYVGFRLCLTRSPCQRFAQVMWPALFGHFVQAFQIDIDHWRFFTMLTGAVWALEVARVRWQDQQRLSSQAAATETLAARPSMSR